MEDQHIPCIHELLEKQTASSPEAIALRCDGAQLTYREYKQRADRLANRLRSLGVQADTLVGICTDRSPDMVVAIFAVFKAAGAYVPLDPSYPQERLSFILHHAQLSVVITEDVYRSLFSGQPVNVVCLDEDAYEPAPPPGLTVSPQNLAYVIYTSGSTGNPKGVMITHSNLSHFVALAGSALEVRREDVYLQTASMSYALSVRQLMIPLSRGATVVLANAEQMRDPLLMFQLIKREKITLTDFVPSFWRACLQRFSELQQDERKELLNNSLRRIVSIGEPLMFDVPHDWFYKLGHPAQLVNIFGQTETTGIVAVYAIPHQTPAPRGIVPIGQAIAGTQLYILNPDLQPVAAGEVGELCVSSPCLARGYLNRLELTANKFIPNPFDDGLSSQLYRTGDMALRRPDGNIEFLGRSDQQVKIRGQRIELGEVESVIRRHESVRDCVVTVRGNDQDDKYLAAYIVSNREHTSAAELRTHARKNLPEIMIPSAFVFLDALPLMPNGKLNRLALPDPSIVDVRERSERSIDLPLSDEERALEPIWLDLFGLSHIGIHQDFFELGGHSLTAVRLFSRIEDRFGLRMPLTTILKAPTIALLADALRKGQGATPPSVLVSIQNDGEGIPFFCVHGVGGGVLAYTDLARELHAGQSVYGLQSIGIEHPGLFDDSIESMASRYIAAIRTVQPHGPYRIGGYCFGGVVAYEMARQWETDGETVSLLAVFEGFVPRVMDTEASIVDRFRAFLKQFPNWVRDYASMSPDDLRQRIRSTVNKIRAKIRPSADLEQRVKVEAILEMDLDQVPHRNIELTEIHSRALHQYQPGTYHGRVTLFRARNRSFNEVVFGCLDQTMGWGALAAGGVDVRLVDGFHRNIHLRPYLSSLASELGKCLKSDEETRHREL